MRPTRVTITPQDRHLALHQSRGLLEDHLRRLAAVPAHGNRKLHIDELFLALLLSFFEPTARSLRLIEDRGNFNGRLKDLDRCARSTTADALAVFDPEHLQPLIEDLRQRVPNLGQETQDLQTITRQIIAADGTYLSTLVDVACWALHHRKSDGKTQAQVRANVQMDVASWTVQVISVSGDDDESEPAAFARDLLRGVLYVVDRNFVDFAFLHALRNHDDQFVLRIKSASPSLRVIESRMLAVEDAEAQVISDQLVRLVGRGAPVEELRLVQVQTLDRNGKPQLIRLLSDLTDPDIAARTLAAIYRQRWQIELFFKWLKTWAGMDHLLSTSRRGITFQLYVAVIAVLMMYVQSGRRVSRYALAALSWVAQGTMSLNEALDVIARREREKALDRARQARRRARKKLA